jgi:NAD(P)H-dependent FMN reductase
MKNIRILCLSGSLRKASYNTAALRAAQTLAPPDVHLALFESLGNLPLFNPDLDGQALPVVDDLRRQLNNSDGLLIASPEYAHGISGVLKNALDWLVSGDEFPYMPVALINTSPRASHAQAALREVIRTMSGQLIEQASVALPLLGSNYAMTDIVNHPEMSRQLATAIGVLRDAIIDRRQTSQS